MTTTQKTNEEIADKCIFRAYSEHTPERKDKILREKLVEALQAKDHEKDEVVAEAISKSVNWCKLSQIEIEKIIQTTIGDLYQKRFNKYLDYDEWVGIRDEMTSCARIVHSKIENAVALNFEALTTPNQKDHETN